MRAKLKTTAPATLDEMEALVGEISALKIRERDVKAHMDAELQSVRERYEDGLLAIDAELASRLPRALAWAEAHAAEFGTARSLAMLHGTIGWRLTPHSLKPLSGWTWAAVLEAIKGIMPGRGYIRIKEEVNRQAILADREELSPTGMRAIGLRVVQEDEFYVEPKLTPAEAREKVSA